MIIISDFAEMGSLKKVLENKSISLFWGTRWSFTEGITRGLGFLHKSNIIHRDLKTHNVLITQRMKYKFTCFCLAKSKKPVKENKTELPTNLKAEGIILRMAPELFFNEPIFSRKSD